MGSRNMKKVFILSALFIMISTFALAGVEDRTTGKSGVTTNIADNTSRSITPSKLRTELNDLWDSSVLQGELETLVDPFIDAAIATVGGGSSYLYTPSSEVTDVTAELEDFLEAHDGKAIVKAGSSILLSDLGYNDGNYTFAQTTDIILKCEIAGTCEIRNPPGNNAIHYYIPDGIALDSKTLVSGFGTATINKDDVLTYASVASTSGYSIGDYVLLQDSVALPNRISSTKTVSNVAWDGTKCVVTTSSSHGYSDSHRVALKGVTGSGSIDVIDGSDGYGRLYNITSLSPTTFSLQSIDNSTDTTTGSVVDCSTGAYSSGGTTYRQATWAVETAKVAGVDSVNNRIYFANELGLNTLRVQSPVLYRYTEARKFYIEGFKLRAEGDTSDNSQLTTLSSIDIIGVPRAVAKDIQCYDSWDACVIFRSTPSSKIINISGNKVPNKVTVANSEPTTTLTGISEATQAVFDSGATAHTLVDGDVVVLGYMTGGYTPLNNSICEVAAATTYTFKCKDTYGNYFNTTGYGTYPGGGKVSSAVSSDSGRLGYLASINSASFGSVVDGIYPEEGRHGITTDGSSLSWKAALSNTDVSIIRGGIPTYNLYMNGKCTGGYGVCWDEHEESYRAIWKNMTCDSSLRGAQFGSYKGQCGQFRGDGTIVNGMECIGGQSCLRFPASDWFRDRQFTLDNITCRDQSTTQSSVKNADKCISAGNSESGSYTSYTNTAFFKIGKMTTIGTSLPLWTDKRVTVDIDTMDVSDYDDAIYCQAGANVNVDRIISSHANPRSDAGSWTHRVDIESNGFNSVVMKSDGTYGGCTARIGELTNTQGLGSNYLQDIFEQSDTTATKYYYLGQYTEHNPNSVTAARVLESGATTLSELTTSSTVFVSNPTVNATDSAYAYFSAKSPDSSATLVLQGAGGSSDGVEINPNKNGGTSEFRVQNNLLRFTPEDSTSTSARIQFTPFADTAIATGEAQFGKFGTGVTVTHDVGSYTSQREWLFYPRTHNYSGASTITNFATVYIDDAPTAGTNATATNAPYAIWSNDGLNRFDDGLVAKYPLATLNTGGVASTPALATETNYTYINTGSTSKANITLPSASVTDGVSNYKACVIDADGIRITAQSGDFIYNGSSASTSGGYIESTTIGSCIELIIIDTTNWMAISSTGTWVLG